MQENKDYTFIHHDEHPDAWAIRLENKYPETIIVFGEVAYDDKREAITYDFQIVESPDKDLSVQDVELQQHVGDILSSVISVGLEEGFVQATDRETGETIT
jgi:hypothetical protein